MYTHILTTWPVAMIHAMTAFGIGLAGISTAGEGHADWLDKD